MLFRSEKNRNSNVRHLFSHYPQMPPPWQHLYCCHKDSEGKMQEQEVEEERETEEAVEEEVEEKNSMKVRFNDQNNSLLRIVQRICEEL